MIKYLYLISILAIILFPIQEAKAEGYELKVRIKNLAGKEIILGHHFADKLFSDDTLKLDNLGLGTLKGNTKFPEGLYFFMTPSHAMFDFFMTSNQRFTAETDTIDLFENLRFYNSPENTAAQEYLKFIVAVQKESAALKESMKNLTDSTVMRKNDSRLKEISIESKAQVKNLIEGQKNNFVGLFIKANQEIEVPNPPRNSDGNILDSTFQYRYYRSHFFDNMNLKDARFLRSPVYDKKIKEYLDQVVPKLPDSISNACDKLLTVAESNPEIFRYMLITLFNKYATSTIMGFDAVYVHIAEKWYIPKATFSDTAFISQTRVNVAAMKPLLLGQTAIDLHMLSLPEDHFIQAKTDTALQKNPHSGTFIDLLQVQAKYTILVFWESDCGHCKKAIPELYQIYQKLKPKGVEVFAVHMLGGIEGKQKWISFVNEHQLYDWLNVWNPYDFSYKKVYDIRTTPVIFVLDQDKKIIAKKLEPKQIEDFLTTRMARDEKNSQLKK
jgi:thiol-disulfide isomerase/thioredoxin